MDYSVLVIGFLTGIISGFLGVGGGLVIVPALILLFGFGAREAVATSILAIFVITLSSVLTHHAHGSVRIRKGIILGLSGALGVLIGAEALKHVEIKTFALLFSGLLIYTAMRMINSAIKKKGNNCPAQKEKENPLAFLLCGLISGILSGFFGVGGGIVMVPFMCFYAGYPKNTASATSSMAILIISFSGILAYIGSGTIDYSAGLAFGLMGALGSYFGASAMNRMQKWEEKNNRDLDWIFYSLFALLMIAATAKMLLEHVF